MIKFAKRAFYLTLISITITLLLFLIIGGIVEGVNNVHEVIYFFVLGGLASFIPFFIATLLYINLFVFLNRRVNKLNNRNYRITFSIILHLFVLLLIFIIDLSNSSFTREGIISRLRAFKEFGAYGVYFLIMIIVNEFILDSM